MFSVSDTIFYFWLLPVVLQIVLPLCILAGWLGRMLIQRIAVPSGTAVRPLPPMHEGHLKAS